MLLKAIHIYDMDGVLVDTSHRYRTLPDGSIDLEFWRANCTPEKIAQDRLLPHAFQYMRALQDPMIFTIIATARVMGIADRLFLKTKLGDPNRLISRPHIHDDTADWFLKVTGLQPILRRKRFANVPAFFWDDNEKNVEAVARLGVHSFHVASAQSYKG